MKHFLSVIFKYVGVSVILLLLYNLGLYLACSFDSDLVKDQVIASQRELQEQGGFNLVFSPLTIQNDNYVDARVVNEIISVDSNHPFESYMKARKNYKPGLTEHVLDEEVGEWKDVWRDPETNEETLSFERPGTIKELGSFVHGDIHTSIIYGKYWHGYLCVYRPLFIFLDIQQTRLLLFGLYVLLFIAFFYMAKRRFGPSIATIYCASLLCMGYFTVAFSLQCALNYVVLMISAIYFIWRIDRMREVCLFFFCVISVSNYVDYLTMPLLSLGVLGSLYLLKLSQEGRDWRYCIRFLAKVSGIWLLGYAGTWLAKWVEYDICFHPQKSLILAGLQQCAIRTERDNANGEIFKGKSFYLALTMCGRAALFAWITVPFVMWQHRFKTEMRSFNPNAFLFLIIACIPLSWYLLLANHTILHYYFTYRLASLTMLGLLLAFYVQVFPLNRIATKQATDP